MPVEAGDTAALMKVSTVDGNRLASTLVNHAGVLLYTDMPESRAEAKRVYEEALELSRMLQDAGVEQAALQGLVNMEGSESIYRSGGGAAGGGGNSASGNGATGNGATGNGATGNGASGSAASELKEVPTAALLPYALCDAAHLCPTHSLCSVHRSRYAYSVFHSLCTDQAICMPQVLRRTGRSVDETCAICLEELGSNVSGGCGL